MYELKMGLPGFDCCGCKSEDYHLLGCVVLLKFTDILEVCATAIFVVEVLLKLRCISVRLCSFISQKANIKMTCSERT